MSARPCRTVSCDADGNERLPLFHRTIRVPVSLWKAVKRRSARDGKAIRWVVDDALDAELIPLIEQLRKLGLRGDAEGQVQRRPRRVQNAFPGHDSLLSPADGKGRASMRPRTAVLSSSTRR